MSQQPSQRSQRRANRQQSRTSRTRPARRAVVEVIDYTEDYAFVHRELLRITFWSVLLLVGMFVVYFLI
jgi:hypothetical protein